MIEDVDEVEVKNLGLTSQVKANKNSSLYQILISSDLIVSESKQRLILIHSILVQVQVEIECTKRCNGE